MLTSIAMYSSSYKKVPVPFTLNAVCICVPLRLHSRNVCVAFLLLFIALPFHLICVCIRCICIPVHLYFVTLAFHCISFLLHLRSVAFMFKIVFSNFILCCSALFCMCSLSVCVRSSSVLEAFIVHNLVFSVGFVFAFALNRNEMGTFL